MATWAEFVVSAPRLAARVRGLLEQYGRGFGYLATVRADGGPRLHPVAPVITGEGLFCFILRSPKRRDLERDGRYALHSLPSEHSDDEALLTGRAAPVTDHLRVSELAAQFGAAAQVDWRLFELTVEVAMVGHPATNHHPLPAYQIWRDEVELTGSRV